MKKEIIKPFDLKKAKAGAKLRTRNGYPVEIFRWDTRGGFPIKGMIKREKQDNVESWTCGGALNNNGESCLLDLVIVEEVEEPKFWSDDKSNTFGGFFIDAYGGIIEVSKLPNTVSNYNIFATEKQAKSVLAMARISQIMANDIENFGGVITDEEWNNAEWKYIIYRDGCSISTTAIMSDYSFLAFHTEKQRDLFIEKYPQLVKDYLMI
jgi:hypothetical protein